MSTAACPDKVCFSKTLTHCHSQLGSVWVKQTLNSLETSLQWFWNLPFDCFNSNSFSFSCYSMNYDQEAAHCTERLRWSQVPTNALFKGTSTTTHERRQSISFLNCISPSNPDLNPQILMKYEVKIWCKRFYCLGQYLHQGPENHHTELTDKGSFFSPLLHRITWQPLQHVQPQMCYKVSRLLCFHRMWLVQNATMNLIDCSNSISGAVTGKLFLRTDRWDLWADSDVSQCVLGF